MFLTLPMITREVSTIVLGVLILLFGLFNIVIGWGEAPIQLTVQIGSGALDKENNEVPRQNVYLDAAPPVVVNGNQADRFDPGWAA